MESSLNLVSWQYENFSSAELVSPPVSPAPPQSPTLYNGAPSSLNDVTEKSIDIGGISVLNITPQSSKASSRAQMASNLLNHLEQFGSGKTEMNDFGMNWNEESVNLGLFEELSEIEYTPPASPKRSFVDQSQHQLTEYSIANIKAEEQLLSDGSDISALTAEFQAILESLPKDNTDALGHVLEIAGIPTTIINGEALVPIEMDLINNITNVDLQSFGMEIDDVNVNIISEDDVEIIDESEIFDLSSISNHGSPASSVYSVIPDDDDHQANVAENILDALLQGDIITAESFLPVMEDDEEDSSMSSHNDSQIDLIQEVASRQTSISTASKTPERRGRKPGKKSAKGSVRYIKDKSIRKKEQNKTAATRYRQKKKMEVALTLEAEAELQQEQDELVKTKDDLHRQIVMVKQLLREVVNARKPKNQQVQVDAGKSIVRVSKLTASNVIRNRRK